MSETSSSGDSLSHAGQEFLKRWGFLLIDKNQAAELSADEAASLLKRWSGEVVSENDVEENDRSGYIYLARMSNDDGYLYKIGRSKNAEERVKVFDVQMPVDVDLVNHFPVDDAAQVEKELHDFHDPWHVEGEWFDPPGNYLVMLKHAVGYEDGGIQLPDDEDKLMAYYEDLRTIPPGERMELHPEVARVRERELKDAEKERMERLKEKDWEQLESKMPLTLTELERLVLHVQRRVHTWRWNGWGSKIPLPRKEDVDEVAKHLHRNAEVVYVGPRDGAEVIQDQDGNILDLTRKDFGDGRGCDGTLRFTHEYLRFRDTSVEDEEEFASWLMDFGGGCDCEVVSNVWNMHWKYRAEGIV